MTFAETVRTNRLYLLGVFLLLCALYWKIVPPMVQQWYNDENYSHGFIVPLISGYFLYTRWDQLKAAPVGRSLAGLIVIMYGLLQLMLGWLGTEYFSMRSSLVIILAGLVLYLFGTVVFRISLLSLAYLFFMIPIPYIVYDAVAFPLKIFVTKVSVLTMKAIGIVVMREGNIIIFPALTLEVADACSGIRSLISLLALAVAYAFYLRISPFRRVVLIFAAVPIAIFTNSARVIMTGILAQFWGAQAAEGFFHEFAGMVVFGLAMVLLVSLGALLSKGGGGTAGTEIPETAAGIQAANVSRAGHLGKRNQMTTELIAVFILLTGSALYLNLHQDLQIPMNRPLNEFPRVVSGWHMTQEFPMSESIQRVLKATDTLSRSYATADGKTVDLYVGYHGGGKESGEIHSPKQCLPGGGWFEISSKRRPLEVSGGKINIVQAIYRKDDSKELFLYWFQVQNKTISDEYSLKIAEITNSILNRRRDASFIRVSLPFGTDEQEAIALGERFTRDFTPALQGFLPQ